MAKEAQSKNSDGSVKSYHSEVASVSAGIIKFFRRTFSEVHVDGPKLDPAEVQKSPVMFVCTHRSHVDYFLIGSNFCTMGFRNIRFAAGDNLTKLPWIGPRFLAFGAFAVSRDGGFERNYVRNLCAKVVEMLEDDDSVLVFPEGGRSYSGGMLDIRGGILNAALMAQAANPARDVYLIPTAVAYESPPDSPFFPLLLKGKKMRKKPNNFIKRFLGGLFYFGADVMAFAPFMVARFFWRRYGAVYMDYGAPVSVKSLVDLEANRIPGARDEFAAHRASLDIVGDKVRAMFVSLFRILPVHVAAAAIKSCGDDTSPQNIEAKAEELASILKKEGKNCKTIDGMPAKEIVKKGLASLRRLKAVKTGKKRVAVTKDHVIDYYAAAAMQQEGDGK